MILRRLSLINFRQYKTLDLQFQDGITGIVGRNGTGKSTILEALLWSLFGTKAARTDKEGIKRQGASSETCRVELEFELRGAIYLVSRSLIGEKNRAEARLTKYGELESISIREVDESIIRLIGLDLKGFLSSFFARQKELNALTDASPTERKNHLAKMLGVGRLDNAIKLLKDDIKEARQKIDILGGFQIDAEAVKKEIADRQAAVDHLLESEKPLKVELSDSTDNALRLEKEITEHRRNEQEFNGLEKDGAVLVSQRDGVEKEIERLRAEVVELDQIAKHLPELKADSDRVDSLRRLVDTLRRSEILAKERSRLTVDRGSILSKETELSKGIEDLSRKAEELKTALVPLTGIDTKITQAEETLEQIRSEFKIVGEELKVVEAGLGKLKKQKEEIGRLGPEAVCQFCLRPFGAELSDIEGHFGQEIRSLEYQAEALGKKYRGIEDAGKQQRTVYNNLRRDQERVTQLEKEQAAAAASLDAVRKALFESEKRKTEIDSRLGELGEVSFAPEELVATERALAQSQLRREEYLRMAERAARREGVVTMMNQAQERLRNLDSSLQKNLADQRTLDFSPQEFAAALSRQGEIQQRINAIKVEQERLAGQVNLLQSEAESLSRKLAEHEKAEAEIARTRELLTYLEKIQILFSEFRTFLIGRIRPTLRRQTSRLFGEMTSGRYQDIELDEDYNLQIYDAGEPFPIERFSGGEVDLANLCLRLAISLEMASSAGIDYSFIILDEIFGSQDSERQRLICEGLGRLKNRFRQIVVISHIEDVKEMAEHLVAVEVDPSGVSVATSVMGA